MKKKLILVLGALLASISMLGAETLFVVAKQAQLYDTASAAGAKLTVLAQGEQLEVISKADKWIEVKSAGGAKGWVGKLFVGEKQALSKKDVGASMSDLTAVATRTRASAYTTSAAATRGLSTDNVRQRENLAFSAYDFTIAPWLDTFTFAEDAVLEFAAQEGLVL